LRNLFKMPWLPTKNSFEKAIAQRQGWFWLQQN
jgi:hypothetical protein